MAFGFRGFIDGSRWLRVGAVHFELPPLLLPNTKLNLIVWVFLLLFVYLRDSPVRPFLLNIYIIYIKKIHKYTIIWNVTHVRRFRCAVQKGSLQSWSYSNQLINICGLLMIQISFSHRPFTNSNGLENCEQIINPTWNKWIVNFGTASRAFRGKEHNLKVWFTFFWNSPK